MRIFTKVTIAALVAGLPTCRTDAEPAHVDEIIVSGQADTAGPGDQSGLKTVVDAQSIAASSAVSLDQVLEKLPEFGFQGVNGNQNDGGFGATFVDLRNLNFNRTLVLVDGRRVVLSGIKTDEAVDLGNIPLPLIDHVDVLKDGSQPLFGPDAIAGAVNVVLKKDFEGAAGSAMAGASGHGDGATDSVAATFGHNFDAGNVTFGVSQSHSNPIRQSDRDWARNPIAGATVNADGTLSVSRGETATPAGHAISGNGIDALMIGDGASRPFNAMTDSYDISHGRDLQSGQDRRTATLLAHQALTDSLDLFTEISAVRRNSSTLEPPATLGLSGTAKYPDGFIVPASNPFNPFGQDVTLQRVLAEVGNQRTDTDATTLRTVAGLDGTLFGGDWTVSLDHGLTHQTYSTINAVNLTKVFNTLSTDPSVCVAAAGCVAANYFGPNSLSPAAATYIRYTDVSHATYRETVAQASYSHPLVTLPAGPWTATLGTEYRTEYGSTLQDPVTVAGDQAGSDAATTSGGYRSRDIVAASHLPLAKGLPFVATAVLDGSARYSSFDRFGAFPTWKIALDWAPVDALHFRGSLGAGRRAPAITEAFGGSTASFLPVQDPCDSINGSLANPTVAANCRKLGLGPGFAQATPLIDVANGGNPDLKPESSRNWTVGTTWTPPWIAGLALSVDYYAIHVRNAIDALSDADPNYIPNQCLASVGMTSPYCSLISRIPSGPNAGQISRILSPDTNIGAIRTDGLDLGLSKTVALDNGDSLSLDWQNTFLFNDLVQETPGAAFVQYAGTFPNLTGGGLYSRYRSTLAVRLDTGPWSAGWTSRYLDGGKVPGSAVAFESKAPGVFYHDVVASWTHEPATVRIGIDNLFDRRPPALMDGVSNTNLASYDVVGRFFYLNTSVQF
jgi:outer membrane receptor protein involved in Fe transport